MSPCCRRVSSPAAAASAASAAAVHHIPLRTSSSINYLHINHLEFNQRRSVGESAVLRSRRWVIETAAIPQGGDEKKRAGQPPRCYSFDREALAVAKGNGEGVDRRAELLVATAATVCLFNAKACVSNITGRDIVMHNTTNGVRVKRWQGGSGSVQGVQFSNIQVSEVQLPIIIDQFYCDKRKCENQTSAVAQSGINCTDVTLNYKHTTKATKRRLSYE